MVDALIFIVALSLAVLALVTFAFIISSMRHYLLLSPSLVTLEAPI